MSNSTINRRRGARRDRVGTLLGIATILALLVSLAPGITGQSTPTVSAAGLPALARSAPAVPAVRAAQAPAAPQAVDAGPTPIQFFYLPLPEDQVRTSLQLIYSGTGTTMTSVTSIGVTALNTVLYYDQWEDGYELDVTNPTQASTKIWGDGNTGNGDVCPLVQPASLCTAPDTLKPGAVIVLRNDVPLPRNPANLFYDGRDKVSATKILTMARSLWAANNQPGTVLADASEVYDLSRWGTDYRLPVGEDLNALSSNMYEYVSLLVVAAQNGTTVTVDKTGNGVTGDDVTGTLNQGDAYQVSAATVGDLTSNAHVTSNKPIQVHLITGDIGSTYESRWYTLLPTADEATSSYYTPVGTVTASYPAAVFVYNPSQTTGITVNYQTQASSGSFAVAAKGVYRFAMPTLSGAHFWTTGNPAPSFMAVGANDTTTNGAANQTYDWGYTLVPETSLTTRFAVGWAPGTGDVPPAANGSPVWVMAVQPTTIYVDYDGNPATGALTAPNGAKYDVSYAVAALASTRIYDTADNNQTGMRVFTADGTLITGAWGEDASTAKAGTPFLDVGYTVPPLPEVVVKKEMQIAVDVNGNGKVDPGDTLEYSVSAKNLGVVKMLGVIVVDELPIHTTYVLDSTTLNGSAVSDNGSGTAYPLDGSGLNIGDIALGATSVVKFRVTANLLPAALRDDRQHRRGGDRLRHLHRQDRDAGQPAAEDAMYWMNFADSDGPTHPANVYLVGDTVYVQVKDNDRNTNPSAADQVSVEVQNPTTGDRETVTLTETGNDTGVFRGSVASSATGGQTVNDGTLYARGGDTITADYTDPVNGDTCDAEATITVPSQAKILYLDTDGADNDTTGDLDRVDPVNVSPPDTITSSTATLGGSSTATIAVAATTSGTSTSTNSLSFSHTPGGGSDRLLLVAVAVGDADIGGTSRTVSSVTYGGTAMTQVVTQASRRRTHLYLQTDKPRCRAPANVVVNLSGTSSVAAGATTFTGVNQTTPLGTAASNSATSGTSGSVVVSSASGELVFSTAAWDEGATNQSISTDAGQTQRWNHSGLDYVSAAASTKPGAASVTSSYTAGDSQEWVAAAVPIKPASVAGTATATFTQTPAMASNFDMPSGGTVGVTAYVNVVSGSMPANPSITAVLKYGATTFATLTNPTYSSGAGTLTWSGALTGNVTVPSGQAVVLEITTTQSGVSFQIQYDSSTKPSKVSLPTTTVIDLTDLQVYDAPYPGGNPVPSPYPGQTVYVRVTATDPFGAADITSVALTLAGTPVTLTNANMVASDANSKTYEYAWTTPGVEAACPVNAYGQGGL